MEFCKELIEKLSMEGIVWERENDGRLVYVGAYEHSSAVVDPSGETFTIYNECCPPGESGVICACRIPDGEPDAEELLRYVAEACGGIDQGIEDALDVVAAYPPVE